MGFTSHWSTNLTAFKKQTNELTGLLVKEMKPIFLLLFVTGSRTTFIFLKQETKNGRLQQEV